MLEPYKDIIKTVTYKRAAEMWCDLNIFKIPEEFKKVLFSSEDRRGLRIAMKDIEDTVGIKLCLKEWRRRIKQRDSTIS